MEHSRTIRVQKNSPSLEVDAARFIAAHHTFLSEKGIRVECSGDFDALDAICKQDNSKAPLNAFFSPELVDTPAHLGLWISGYNEDCDLVHLQALRCDDLGWTTLADWWRMHFRRIYNCPMGREQHPVAENISGRVVFHGEFWMDQRESPRYLWPALARFGMAVAAMRWRPDYLYGLTSERNSNAGFAARGGYRHKSENAVDWAVENPPWDPSDHMIWNDWQDLVDLVSSPPEAYFSGL